MNIYIYINSVTLNTVDFRISIAVGVRASNCNREVQAIFLALTRLKQEAISKEVHLVDSQAANIALTSMQTSESGQIRHARDAISDLVSAGRTIGCNGFQVTAESETMKRRANCPN